MRLKIEELSNKIKEARDTLNEEYNSLGFEDIVKRKRSIARMVRDLKALEKKNK